jgi:hypothetical protein
MKNLVLAVALGLTVAACNPGTENVSEDVVENTPTLEYFGEEISWDGAEDVASLLNLNEEAPSEVKVRGVITEVCQMKGCWMTLDLGNGETMRVTFKDYGFFVPKDAAGREVVIEGIPSMKMTDVETLRHYAEDAGKSEEELAAITEGKNQLSFEAKGVVIK